MGRGGPVSGGDHNQGEGHAPVDYRGRTVCSCGDFNCASLDAGCGHLNHGMTALRTYPDSAIEYGGMVHYVDDDHKTHHPDVTCQCSPTPVWMPRP